MNEDEALAFVRANIRSVSTLQLLLLLKRSQGSAWQPDDLVRELRSSRVAVGQALDNLKAAGLVSSEGGRYAFTPLTARHAEFAHDIERLYALKPIALITAIITEPGEKLKQFSDAFKLEDPPE